VYQNSKYKLAIISYAMEMLFAIGLVRSGRADFKVFPSFLLHLPSFTFLLYLPFFLPSYLSASSPSFLSFLPSFLSFFPSFLPSIFTFLFHVVLPSSPSLLHFSPSFLFYLLFFLSSFLLRRPSFLPIFLKDVATLIVAPILIISWMLAKSQDYCPGFSLM
jgi:hypothetical protein